MTIKKYYKYILILFAWALFFISPIEVFADNSNDDNYCYEMACLITEASIDYLNEIYVEKYPYLGTGYLYGSDADKAVLKTMTDKIVSGLTTDKQK